MNNIIKMFLLCGVIFTMSCTDYLDVVPDNTMTLNDIFRTRKNAAEALANAYGFLPEYDASHSSPWLLGDEYIGSIVKYDQATDKLLPIRVMRNLQSVSNPTLGQWSGTGGAKPLYQGINQCNIFLENIDNVGDMEETAIKDWKAQVTFLKAYYHFLLVQSYGPIVISDHVVSPEETDPDVLFPSRRKIDECFDYIIGLIDAAIPDLKGKTAETDLGQINKSIATAIKARILVTRARPFFNGNRDIYGDFYDHDGQPFFPQEYKVEKWQDAVKAIDEAINTCTSNGFGLYHYPATKNVANYDEEDAVLVPDRMQSLYDLRYVAVDPWNNEIIWGYSRVEDFSFIDYERWASIQNAAMPKLPNKQIYSGNGEFEAKGNVFGSGQWMAASYRMEERFYTKNGLPITEDRTFNQSTKLDIVTTPGIADPDYTDIAGIMQPGVQTINLHLNRELRFYTNLGISGSYFRAQRYRINTLNFYREDGGRGMGQQPEECFYATGIGVQKLVHPESSAGQPFRSVFYSSPIIRMADLYLMKAEALNESSGPNQQVWSAINEVRRRAGIPDVETVWSDATLARTPNKHQNQLGMREIILQERANELAFEGSRYWDVIGYKQAVNEFSRPILGWNDKGMDARSFFNLEAKQSRRFTPTNYLWPIDLNEINTNANLIQNPGW